MNHSESEIRGMIETQRKAVEAIAVRCAQEGYAETAYTLAEALNRLQEAKIRVAGETPKQGGAV